MSEKIFISLNGKSHHRFDHLRIEQSISGHHRFEITYRLDCFSSATATFFEDTKTLVGKEIVIEIHSAGSTGHFRGLVTEIASSKADHQHSGSVIHVRGYSPTILMEDGANCASYLDQDLKTIVRRATTGYPENQLKININPRNKNTFHYVAQYNESNFSFVRRMAMRHGEWLFYDGQELVFGQNNQDTATLIYGVNLQEFELETKLRPQKFGHITHDYWHNKDIEVTAGETYTMARGIAKHMADESSNFFLHTQKEHTVQPTLEGNSNQVLREMVKLKKDGQMGNMVQMNGISKNPALKVGHVVDVKGDKLNFGSYIITKLIHTSSTNGYYSNIFEAIPFDQLIPPDTNPDVIQVSGDQVAVISDNNDPEGMGRVRVRFPWSTNLTPWLRMVMPHAGSDKGLYFIPETGEEVLVGFEGGDVEKPYVKGTLYNGNAKAAGWKTKGNDIKAIRTRSGHTIELNDKGGSEMITISDKNGNVIQLDTAGSNMTITTPQTLTINAKNLIANIEEDAQFKIGKKTTINTGEDLGITAKNVSKDIEEGFNIQVGGSLNQVAGDTNIESSDGDLKLSGAGEASLKGGSNVKISKG